MQGRSQRLFQGKRTLNQEKGKTPNIKMLRKIGRDKKSIKQKLDAILSEIFTEQKKELLEIKNTR